jgi:hypothetical protein
LATHVYKATAVPGYQDTLDAHTVVLAELETEGSNQQGFNPFSVNGAYGNEVFSTTVLLTADAVGSAELQMPFDYQQGYAIDSPDLVLGTGDFTIDLWLQIDSVMTTRHCELFRIGGDPNSEDPKWGALWAQYVPSLTTLWIMVSADDLLELPLAMDEPVHLAISRQSGVLRGFVNGAVIASAACTTDFSIGDGNGTIGGPDATGGRNPFRGWLQGFRITQGVVRYWEAFSAPTTATRASHQGAVGATEPTWPVTPGTSVVDGEITWTCMGHLVQPVVDGFVLPV